MSAKEIEKELNLVNQANDMIGKARITAQHAVSGNPGAFRKTCEGREASIVLLLAQWSPCALGEMIDMGVCHGNGSGFRRTSACECMGAGFVVPKPWENPGDARLNLAVMAAPVMYAAMFDVLLTELVLQEVGCGRPNPYLYQPTMQMEEFVRQVRLKRTIMRY